MMLRGSAGGCLRKVASGKLQQELSGLPLTKYSYILAFTPCQGCQNRQWSTSASCSASRFRSLKLLFPWASDVRNLATSSEDTDKVKTQTSKSEPPKLDTIVKVQHSVKRKQRPKTDFSKSYPDNIFITPVRAMVEYLLDQSDIEALPKQYRRSPYREDSGISVLRRRDVEQRAKERWGSMEALQEERKKRKSERKLYHANVFNMKTAVEEYKKQHVPYEEEKPFIFSATKGKGETAKESIFKSGSGKVVLYAIGVNGANCILKFLAWCYTGSHSMFAEFVHSLADTVNQIILAVGIHQSLKQPDQEHPYGWANFRNVASLISGVGIFCLGSGFSIYHGISGLLRPEELGSLFWAIGILGGSFISEGATLVVAYNAVRNNAKANNMTPKEFVWRGMDPSTNVVLLEDMAAVTGVTIASICLGLAAYTGSSVPDAVGSLIIGSLLGGVALFIVHTNAIALVGRSIPVEKKLELTKELEDDRMIRTLHDVKATEMGGSSIKFKAEVDFDGREVTRLYLERQDMEKMLSDIQTFKGVEELENFMLAHGENIVDTLGGEVDRIEKNLVKKHPEIRHVDLEQL